MGNEQFLSETVSHDFHLCDQEFSVEVSEAQVFCSTSFLILTSPLPVLYPFFSDKIYPLGEQDISLIRFFRILRVHMTASVQSEPPLRTVFYWYTSSVQL